MPPLHPPRAATPDVTALPEHSPDSPLSVHDVTVAYRHKPVLWDVDFDAPPGAMIAIVGPNGAGKSTLLKAALGLVPLASGGVAFWGKPFAKVRRRVAYVPQRESVDWEFPVSVLDVAAMGRYGRLGWFRRVGRADRDAAMACLERVGMDGYAGRQIAELSGGQQQRVFIARALAQEADLYLMDEPLAGVDAATERTIIGVLGGLRSAGKTIVAVHHDLQTVPEYFDHALLINTRVIAAGPVAGVFTKPNLHATYGGRLTLMDEAAQELARTMEGLR
ncbi:MAG: metal ABC transporter ATP-binding protein [Phycisphaeraceae bacterium]|nr:MAG: metal ABC transporter ATP-binding protein [Phycisphaeraceae bacterium]